MAKPIHVNDLDADGRISRWEWDLATRGLNQDEEIQAKVLGQEYTGTLSQVTDQLRNVFAAAGDANDPQGQVGKLLDSLRGQMDGLAKAIADAQAAKDEARVEVLVQQLKEVVAQAQRYNSLLPKGKQIDINPYKQAAGLNSGNFKASATSSNRVPTSGTLPGGPKAQGVGGGTSFFPPAGWGKAQTAAPYFNSGAYLQSMAMEDNIMSAWDSINKNTNRGKQLMMLFFYFARNAESGDMGAMYQFMKFITYIISKDKAKQQIEMGKKLIQLQELSRKWTSKLLNVQSNSADPAASNELMKTMTIVKSETDAIATSQKLISQMMEEFAQVVESLTNSTKAALDAHGRILRTVSRVG